MVLEPIPAVPEDPVVEQNQVMRDAALKLHDILKANNTHEIKITNTTIALHFQTWILANLLVESQSNQFNDVSEANYAQCKALFIQLIILGESNCEAYKCPFPFQLCSDKIETSPIIQEINFSQVNKPAIYEILRLHSADDKQPYPDTEISVKDVFFKAVSNFLSDVMNSKTIKLAIDEEIYEVNSKAILALKAAYLNHLQKFGADKISEHYVALVKNPFYGIAKAWNKNRPLTPEDILNLLKDADQQLTNALKLNEKDIRPDVKPEILQELLCFQFLQLVLFVNRAAIEHTRNLLQKKLSEMPLILPLCGENFSPNDQRNGAKIVPTQEVFCFAFNEKDLEIQVSFNQHYEVHVLKGICAYSPMMEGISKTIFGSLSQIERKIQFHPFIVHTFSSEAKSDFVIQLAQALNPKLCEENLIGIHSAVEVLHQIFVEIEHVKIEEKNLVVLENELRQLVQKVHVLNSYLNVYHTILSSGLEDRNLIAFVDRVYSISRMLIAWQRLAVNNGDLQEEIAYCHDLLLERCVPLMIRGTSYKPQVSKHESQNMIYKIKSDKYGLALNQLQEALQSILRANGPISTIPAMIAHADGECKRVQASLITLNNQISQEEWKLKSLEGGWRNWFTQIARATLYRTPLPGPSFETKERIEGRLQELHSQKSRLEDAKCLLECVMMICKTLIDDRSPTKNHINSGTAEIGSESAFKDTTYLNKVRMQMLSQYMDRLSVAAAILLKYYDRRMDLGEVYNIYFDTLTRLTHFMHTSINLEQHLLQLTEVCISEGNAILEKDMNAISPKSENHDQPLVAELRQTYRQFQALYKADGVSFFTEGRFDRIARSVKNSYLCYLYPNGEGNPHHLMYVITLPKGKQVKILAHGTPTRQEGSVKAEVVPEWRLFLKSLTMDPNPENHKKYGYFSFQSLIPPSHWWHEDETYRGNAIMLQQEEPGCETSYIGFTASKDSLFYSQKGQGVQSADVFKNQLKAQFDHRPNTTGFYAPEKIRKRPGYNFDGKIETIINQIHYIMFEYKKDLTEDEKRQFQGIYYVCLFLMNIYDYDLDLMSIICKDMADRAMMEVVKLFTCLKALSDEESTGIVVNKIKADLMARAYETRKRPPDPHRVERFFLEINFILQHKEKWKGLFHALFGAGIPKTA